jgi:hypothetical protein
MEDPMEPANRPYIDPSTEPGDAGTEPWANEPSDSQAEDQTKRGPLVDPAAAAEDAAIDGSPADQFLTEEDAVSAPTEDPDKPAGD